MAIAEMKAETPNSTSASSLEKDLEKGPDYEIGLTTGGIFGRYHDPVLPASRETKKIVSDMISLAGGSAAVLLQIAQPGVGAGVSNNSSFTTRPIERGRRSMVYIYATVLGTLEERRYITDATHLTHEKIKAANYNANDPELQLWVAVTMYWSMIESYENIYGKLDTETTERVYKEFSIYATSLNCPPEMWPKDLAAYREYFDKMLDTLVVTPQVLATAQDVLYLSGLPLLGKLVLSLSGPLTRITTREMLPEKVRDQFGIPSTPHSRRVYKLITGVTRVVYPSLPKFVKHGMKNFYMWDMRRRMKKDLRW